MRRQRAKFVLWGGVEGVKAPAGRDERDVYFPVLFMQTALLFITLAKNVSAQSFWSAMNDE
jgi:hypothetical protein